MTDLPAAIAAAREALAKRDELAHRGNRRAEERANWECAQHLAALLAALDAATPVAWMTTGGDVSRSYAWAAERCMETDPLPLYLAPQAPPAAVDERGRDPGKPIAELMEQYESEGCDFSDTEWVRKAAMRYVLTMPDSQVRCLLYALAKAPPAAVPAGYALVPVEPTPAMRRAAVSEYEDAMGGARLPDGNNYDEEVVSRMYQAMIDARARQSAPSKA